METENQIQPPASDQANDTAKRLSFEDTLRRVRQAPVLSDEQIAEMQREEWLRKRDDRVRSFMGCAGQRLSKCRFENFAATTDYQKQVVKALEKWCDTFTERRGRCEGIVLYGPVGTGKDHLVFSAVGTVVHEYGLTAKWVNGRELVGQVRDRITQDETESGLIHEMTSPEILVISDPLPPIGELTQHQADMIYRICDARYARSKLTVSTLNVASDDEADRRLGAATWDRLCHGAWKIACMWASYRKPSLDMRPKQ